MATSETTTRRCRYCRGAVVAGLPCRCAPAQEEARRIAAGTER